MSQPTDQPDLIYRESGRPDVQARECTCGHCEAVWYVPAPRESGQKWHPSFCPFCGTAFDLMTIDDDPATYNPR